MNFIWLKQQIEKAILDGNFLKIDYVSKKMEITNDRIIRPIELKQDTLYGHDFAKNGLRQFQFDGIQKLEVVSPEKDYGTTNENKAGA